MMNGGGKGNRINEQYSAIIGGQDNNVNANYSLAFGNGVTVSNDYVSAFYSTDHPGTVKITHFLELTPLPTPPPVGSVEEGTVCVAGTGTNRHIYCKLNGAWKRLDN